MIYRLCVAIQTSSWLGEDPLDYFEGSHACKLIGENDSNK